MKFSVFVLVAGFIFAALALPIKAAFPEQAESAAASSPSQYQLWENPGKLEALKDIVFDFDTHESAAERATLDADAQWLTKHPNC